MFHPTRLRAAALLFAAALLIGTTVGSAAGPAGAMPVPPEHCTDTYTLAHCIGWMANIEYSNETGHKYEKPLGSNCNYYTTKAWHAAGAYACSNGYWSEEWCMDFSRWVYKSQGASVRNITHLAFSAKDYPSYQTYASGRRPHEGDLAVWASESHVGIVVAVNNGQPTVVSGNSYNPARDDYTAIYKKVYSASTFQGFAKPLSA